jgi:hypothetical protein
MMAGAMAGAEAADSSVYGQVLAGPHHPQVERYIIAKDVDVCGTGYRDVPLVRTQGDALLDTVVILEGVKGGRRFPAAARKVTINQSACSFEPNVVVLMQGGELEVINSDPVLHNIHVNEMTLSGPVTRMNVSQPEKGGIVTRTFELNQGTALKLTCHAHSFMHAHVFIARTPYYAMVDSHGRFKIDGVPAGKYTLRTWHPYLGERRMILQVKDGGQQDIQVEY